VVQHRTAVQALDAAAVVAAAATRPRTVSTRGE